MRTFSVKCEGDYICDCGRHFHYPPMNSTTAKYVTAPVCIDSSSRSIKKSMRYNRKFIRDGNGELCNLAKVSLGCGMLGLVGMGIMSVPAVLFGIFALNLITDPFNNYRGTTMAYTGIAIGAIGAILWISYYIMR